MVLRNVEKKKKKKKYPFSILKILAFEKHSKFRFFFILFFLYSIKIFIIILFILFYFIYSFSNDQVFLMVIVSQLICEEHMKLIDSYRLEGTVKTIRWKMPTMVGWWERERGDHRTKRRGRCWLVQILLGRYCTTQKSMLMSFDLIILY